MPKIHSQQNTDALLYLLALNGKFLPRLLPTRLLTANDIPFPTEYMTDIKLSNIIFDASSTTPIVPARNPHILKVHQSIHIMNADGNAYFEYSPQFLKLSLLIQCHDSSGTRSGCKLTYVFIATN